MSGTPGIRARGPSHDRRAPVAAAIAAGFFAAGFFVILAIVPAWASPAGASPADRPAVDPVLFWNDQTNRAIQVTSTDPFNASRALAMESVAVLDTVRSLAGSPGILVRLAGAPHLNASVAVAAAARRMLSCLFPAQRDALAVIFETSIAAVPADVTRERSAAFGAAVADAVFAVRDHDGWRAVSDQRPDAVAGKWRPTPSKLLPPLAPQWGSLVPFMMTKPNQFRPPEPPALGSAVFREATASVRSVGEKQSSTRTPAQTEIAHYWSDAIGTYAPAGHWNAIAARLVAPMGLGLDTEAELFARLNVAMADAGIAMADAKYTYWFWRPVTVIRLGGDGSPPRPDWSPLLETPNHPSYVSGHSAFSGAAASVLTAAFGDRPFTFVSDSMPGVTRSFTSFQQAAEEAAASRVYGGIHFPFDNAAGLATGRMVGAWTLSAFRRLGEDRGPFIALDRPEDASPWEPREVSGYALDNAAPVKAVSIRLDGGAPIVVAVDERGRFAMRLQLHGTIGAREAVVTARDAAGRTTTARLAFDRAGGHGVDTAPVSVK
jgi:membrane-associated phospholipid phosphatase